MVLLQGLTIPLVITQTVFSVCGTVLVFGAGMIIYGRYRTQRYKTFADSEKEMKTMVKTLENILSQMAHHEKNQQSTVDFDKRMERIETLLDHLYESMENKNKPIEKPRVVARNDKSLGYP